VKPEMNESPDHAFFVRVIEQEARKYSEKVRIAGVGSLDPDVVFETPVGEIAFEVETGLSNRNSEETRKKLDRIAKGYHDLVILVVNKYERKEFSKYGNAITRTGLKSAISYYFSGAHETEGEKGEKNEKK
jgi:hypothetical protein